jgi:hypothetical protein
LDHLSGSGNPTYADAYQHKEVLILDDMFYGVMLVSDIVILRFAWFMSERVKREVFINLTVLEYGYRPAKTFGL